MGLTSTGLKPSDRPYAGALGSGFLLGHADACVCQEEIVTIIIKRRRRMPQFPNA